jgi:hypothetical protein
MKINNCIWVDSDNNLQFLTTDLDNTRLYSLTLEPYQYEHIVPLDYVLDTKDLSDCEELWELFDEHEDDHLIEVLYD